MAKTFIYKGTGSGGLIPLGPEQTILRVEPGVPFTVPAEHAGRFIEDPEFEAVTTKPKKGGDDK